MVGAREDREKTSEETPSAGRSGRWVARARSLLPFVGLGGLLLAAWVWSRRQEGGAYDTGAMRCIPLPEPERSRSPEGAHPLALGGVPRLRRTWTFEDVGPVVSGAGRNLYVLSRDGSAVVSLDLTDGSTRWRATVAPPVRARATLLGGESVLLLGREDVGASTSGEPTVAGLAPSDGKLLWSRTLDCRNMALLRAGATSVLSCGDVRNRVVVALDARGRELARAPIQGTVVARADGELCGVRNEEVWCGTLEGEKIVTRWVHDAPRGTFEARLAGDLVLTSGRTELVARDAGSGGVLWTRSDAPRIAHGGAGARVVLLDDAGSSVVRAADGHELARIEGLRGARAFVAGEGVLVLEPGGPGPLRIVDERSTVRAVAAVSGVLHGFEGGIVAGLDSLPGEPSTIEGYSFEGWATPVDELDHDERTALVLRHYRRAWDAGSALAELEGHPGWQPSVARLIEEGPAAFQPAAMAVAARSRDPFFLPAMRRRLTALATEQPADARSRYYGVLSAIGSLNTSDAAWTLLTFWEANAATLRGTEIEQIVRREVSAAVWRFGARDLPGRCGDVTFPLETTSPDRARIGSDAPAVPSAGDPARRWAVVCEAREDSDGDGRVAVAVLHHGDLAGDAVYPYLVLGGGAGTRIDQFLDADPSGTKLVVARDFCVDLVDVTTGKGVALVGADARRGGSMGRHRAVSFSPDGTLLAYIRSDGDRSTVVLRTLASGAERVVDSGPGLLASIGFDGSGRWLLVDLVVADTDGDGRIELPTLVTTRASGDCVGGALSASSYGVVGDAPVRRFVSVETGVVADAVSGRCFEPRPGEGSPCKLVPTAPAAPGETVELKRRGGSIEGRPLDRGPMRWKCR